jgi:hypothetical protein
MKANPTNKTRNRMYLFVMAFMFFHHEPARRA